MIRQNVLLSPGRAPFWRRLWSALHRWQDLHQSRQRLLKLNDHLLRDIGLSRDDAMIEAARPAWDVPPHWTR